MAPPTSKENKNPKRQKEKKPPNRKLRNYLFQLLLSSEIDQELAKIIKWTKKQNLEFQLVDREEVCRRWSIHKGSNKAMDYESISRSLRSYYAEKCMEKIPGKNFRYKFLPDAWTTSQLAQANARKNNFSIAKILGTSGSA